MKIFISLESQEERELDVEELDLIIIKIRKLLRKVLNPPLLYWTEDTKNLWNSTAQPILEFGVEKRIRC